LERFVNLTVIGLSTGVVYAAFALALVLIWRGTRVVNFAQGAMAVAAVYVGYTVTEETHSYWLGFVTAIAAGLVLGCVVELGVMRFVAGRAPANAVIAALGIVLVLQAVLGMVYTTSPRAMVVPFSRNAMLVGDYALFSPFEIFVLATVGLLVAGLALLFGRTRVGLRLRATAFAPEVSRLLGVNVARMRTLGWALAAGVGALASLLVLPTQLGLNPNAMDLTFITSFTGAVLGGLDSPPGAVVGGLTVGLTLAYVTGYLGSDVSAIAVLVVLLVVLLIRPDGLFSGVAARRV
jgi:branched-chain amino acid transport system permease protein